MAPAAAEMMDALGARERIVAIGDFVEWPPEIRDLPRIGGYDTPNEERLLGLEVDVLITSRSEAAAPRMARLEELGVKVLALDTGSYDGVFESLLRIGRFLGQEERAQALESRIRHRLDELRQRAANAPRKRVLVVVGRDPLYVAGPGSCVDELVTLAGGENIAGDALSTYQLVSLEAMLERRPEIIIDTSDNHPHALRGRFPGPWAQWSFLPAVENDRVYSVDPIRLVIPGPRLPEMAELVGRMIHPEIFGTPSPEELGALRQRDRLESSPDHRPAHQ